MQKIMTSMILLLTIFTLSSCRLLSKAEKKIVCKEVKRNDIKPRIFCDLRITEEVTRCRCRCFDLDDYKLADDNKCDTDDVVFKSGNYPLSVCNGIAGFQNETWAINLKPKLRRYSKIKRSQCK